MQVSALKNQLKKQSTATGDGVARTFLRAQVALFGSYRDALRYKPVSYRLSFRDLFNNSKEYLHIWILSILLQLENSRVEPCYFWKAINSDQMKKKIII